MFYKARTTIVYNSAGVEHNSQKYRNNEKNYNDEKCNSYDNYYFCYNTDEIGRASCRERVSSPV